MCKAYINETIVGIHSSGKKYSAHEMGVEFFKCVVEGPHSFVELEAAFRSDAEAYAFIRSCVADLGMYTPEFVSGMFQT